MDKKTIAGILGGIIAVGGTYTLTAEQVSDLQAEVEKTNQEKHLILKDNVWKSARLNEIPIWDISTVSAEEMSQAYVSKAEEVGATTNPNLFEGLKEEAIKRGINCK